MTIQDLQRLLGSRKKFEFKITDNRSTMLSVRWEPGCTKVSLHRMFLSAPENIMDQLACYLKKEHKSISHEIKAFIEDNLKRLDYSHVVDKQKLDVAGTTYNLKEIYDRINARYFDSKLNLNITWFGKKGQKNRSRVTFGLYHESLKLIKINRMMDSTQFPDYIIDFVVYHEMLHHVCPSYYDDKGIHRVHSKEFREKERDFEHFEEAHDWIDHNLGSLFTYL